MAQEEQKSLEAQRQAAEEARRKELDELVEKIKEARSTVDSATRDLHDMSMSLRTLARRSSLEGASGYTLFANAHIRLTGALSQSSKRTASLDRVLKVSKDEQQEAREFRAESAKKADKRAIRKQIEREVSSSQTAFEEIYGGLFSSGPEADVNPKRA